MYRFEALLVIGGFEAFIAVSQRLKARDQYEAFKIPLILLPANIGNDVPRTKSLGNETYLNTLVNFL
jgi:6-phosphofructokinase 1